MRVAATTTLQDLDVEVECTHCKVAMTAHSGSGAVRYFHCASCHRWVSSMYSEVLRADAKMHARKKSEGVAAAFDAVKERLDRWLSALDAQDPYRVLGVSKADPAERIRERYRELAMQHHPDRGGSIERMRQINDAYERIALHREQLKSPIGGPAQLPAPSGQ